MDDFGMLARDLGFRPQGKSTPMKPSSSATATEENHIFSDVFGGPPKHTNSSKSTSAMTDFDYDVIFKNSAPTNNEEAKSKATSVKLPVYDKPAYDNDIFDGLSGLKSKSMSSSASPRYEENIFASMSTSPSKRNQQSDHFDDLKGNPSRAQKVAPTKQNRSKSPSGFDDLIPGFGSGRPATSNRSNSEPTPKSTTNTKETSNTMHNLFVVHESSSTTANSHQSFSIDPLEEIGNVSKFDSPKTRGSSASNGTSGKSAAAFTSKDSTQKASFRYSESRSQEMPAVPRNHHRSFDESTSPPSSSQSENIQVADDIWLTVSEIPLFTKPTNAPPPSRPPPPTPRHILKSERGSLRSNSRKVGNGLSSPNSSKYPQSPTPFQAAATSPLSDSHSAEEMDSILAAAAMKEAMDRAEAKFRHAKEVREREHVKASRNKESVQDEEREKGKQAVERATREARERAATEARLKMERAAVQRAQAEARERAATDAREKEKAAVEARKGGAQERTAASRINQQKMDDEFESFFSSGSRSSSAPKRGQQGAHTNIKKSSVTVSVADDLSSMCGGGKIQVEVEGESEERRRARLEREQRTQERTVKALAEKNERDLQSQREQEERHVSILLFNNIYLLCLIYFLNINIISQRIGGALDTEIKRWAAGREGNLRALLSSLQYVLWPECGWQAVSLTDLITGANVKKAYRKATLCIHPDKVQQKGATLQQKYVAEKVFDILKEAWNKFNSEELF
ncbi:auxilin-related protein 2 isoform X1 [Lactuca sativa]|uniref:auxilin-related protein 2 isoform X1 n=1 Tax=Lactuca sativa TaxID=4236 RepID=UPI000CD94D6B|nr:auxilin-related protein 2 isoform X1 [Lactuca sativa]